MKSYKQVREILAYIRLFHVQMREFYHRLHKKDEQQRIKIILDFLCRHEKHREETLAQYEAETSKKILDTWFQYIPEHTVSECLEDTEIQANMSVDDVIGIALDLDNCIIETYMALIEETDVDEVKEVFSKLLKRLESEKKNLMRDSLWLYDV
ncbi:MAG: hypothetical protein ACOCZL_05705 [Bacteroidota bacterium]